MIASRVLAKKLNQNNPVESIDVILNSLCLPTNIARIAIKLNLCDFRGPETGAVSDPFIVGPLLKSLRDRYPRARILLVENDSTVTLADELFHFLGFDLLARRYGASVLNLARDKWQEKGIDGLVFKRIDVPKSLEEADLLITHPKLKTHGFTKITCGLKNMFGCFRPKNKVPYHVLLDEIIADVNLALKPHVSIVDANICQESFAAPAFGLPRRLGLLICGTDVVATDAFCAELAGFKARSIGHIMKSVANGLGTTDYWIDGDISFEAMKMYRLRFNRLMYYGSLITRGVLWE